MTLDTSEKITPEVIDSIDELLTPINWRLSADVKEMLKSVSDQEARFLVDYYYMRQDSRMRENNQITTLKKGGESCRVLEYLFEQSEKTEGAIKKTLDIYTMQKPVGQWMRKQYGFGPVLTAAFMAYVNIERSPTAGHLWSYAGLNPSKVWNKNEKRPWNAELKRLCWLAGECIIKTSGKESSYYGMFYKQVKAELQERNEQGAYREQAEEFLNEPRFAKMRSTLEKNKQKREKTHKEKAEAFQQNAESEISFQEQRNNDLFRGAVSYWEEGKLAPAHIHARARRMTVKLFLAHLHHVMWCERFESPPPIPYSLAFLGHVHYYAPPDYPYGYESLIGQAILPRGYKPEA